MRVLRNTELRRFARNKMTVAALIVAMCIPLLYGALYLWAFWNPTAHLDQVPVALVMQDRGAKTSDGLAVRAGQAIADNLVDADALDWTTTSAADAEQGLEAGRYYAVLTIPSNFSASVASVGGAHPVKAPLRVAYNDANGYTARTILNSVMGSVRTATSDTLGARMVDQVLVGYGDIHAGLVKATDGAKSLAVGTEHATDGAAKLATGADSLAAGADRLATGVGTASTGAQKLAAGSQRAADGATALADGSATVAAGSKRLASGLPQAVTGSQRLSSGATAAKQGADAIETGARALATGLPAAQTGAATLAQAALKVADGASAASTGAATLASSADTLADGAATLVSRLTAAPGATRELSEGASRVSTGASAVANGAVRTASGASALAAALDRAAATNPELAPLATKAETLARGAAEVSAGAKNVATGAQGLSDGASRVSTGLEVAVPAAQQFGAGVRQWSAGATALARGVAQVGDGSTQLATGASALAAGLNDAVTGSDKLAAGAKALSTGTDSLAAGATTLATNLAAAGTGATDLADGAAKVAAGNAALAENLPQLAAGATSLQDGLATAASGSTTLAGSAYQLAAGATALHDGTTRLESGSGDLASQLATATADVPTWSAAEAKATADVMAAPVSLDSEFLHQAAGNGEGFAPYFIGLALYVGALILWMLLRPLSPRSLAAPVSATRVVLSNLLPAAIIGAAQVALLVLVLLFGLGLDPSHTVAFVAFALLVSLAFIALQQAIYVWLGSSVGRLVVLVLLMLQLTSAGGTYPAATTPSFFQMLNGVLPMTQVVNGFRAVITGDLGIESAHATAYLALLLVASVLVAIAGAARSRVYTMTRLHPAVSL